MPFTKKNKGDSCKANRFKRTPTELDRFPSVKYTPELAIIVGRVKAAGWSDEHLCKVLGVSKDTLKKWHDAHPDFAIAMEAGKEVAVRSLVHAGLEAATGYDYEEVTETIKVVEEGEGKKKKLTEVVEKITRKKLHRPPDAHLLVFFLTNLSGGAYRPMATPTNGQLPAGNPGANPEAKGKLESDQIVALAGKLLQGLTAKMPLGGEKHDVIDAEVISRKDGGAVCGPCADESTGEPTVPTGATLDSGSGPGVTTDLQAPVSGRPDDIF